MALKSKEFPSQTENRKQWILDVVCANQVDTGQLLIKINIPDQLDYCKSILTGMHKSDRDALLLPNGILHPDQIEMLK